MKANWYPAPKHLESFLTGIWTLASGKGPLAAKVVPDGTPYIVLQRDGTRLISSDNGGQRWSPGCVSGPRSSSFDFELSPSGQIFIVQLSSSGGLPILGLPMSELKDRCEEIDNVVGIASDVHELSEQIMSSSDSGCLRLIEGWIEKRICANSRSQAVSLVSSIREKRGNTSVVEMADQMNISRRHLNRLLQQEVGLSPKNFARIIRFDAAVQLCRIRPTISLAMIAQRAGYSDQAHMNREFVQIGGVRPGDLHRPGGDMIW